MILKLRAFFPIVKVKIINLLFPNQIDNAHPLIFGIDLMFFPLNHLASMVLAV
jgi:hypothetical protein